MVRVEDVCQQLGIHWYRSIRLTPGLCVALLRLRIAQTYICVYGCCIGLDFLKRKVYCLSVPQRVVNLFLGSTGNVPSICVQSNFETLFSNILSKSLICSPPS